MDGRFLGGADDHGGRRRAVVAGTVGGGFILAGDDLSDRRLGIVDSHFLLARDLGMEAANKSTDCVMCVVCVVLVHGVAGPLERRRQLPPELAAADGMPGDVLPRLEAGVRRVAGPGGAVSHVVLELPDLVQPPRLIAAAGQRKTKVLSTT